MTKKNDLILSLNEDTFAALKKDFDSILNRTIGNMEMKGASDATITLKLTVSLDRRSMTVGDTVQEFKKPTFKHEINSVMQIKDKATGQLGGEYAMVWDPDEERFVLRQFTGGQTSMFDDDDYEIVEDEGGSEVDTLALPTPCEENGGVQEVGTPFGWLSRFIGKKLIVTEAMGNYTVRTEDNRVVLSSATSEENPFWCPADKLAPHVGHNVVCVCYGDDDIENVSIECEDCNEVLFDIDAQSDIYEEDESPSDSLSEDHEEELDYEDPEE